MTDIDKVIERLDACLIETKKIADTIYELHACDRASASEWWQKHFFAEGVKQALYEVRNLKQELEAGDE